MGKPSRHRCVLQFISAFELLSTEDRKEVIGEMAGLCVGYAEGKSADECSPIDIVDDPEFTEDPMFARDATKPQRKKGLPS